MGCSEASVGSGSVYSARVRQCRQALGRSHRADGRAVLIHPIWRAPFPYTILPASGPPVAPTGEFANVAKSTMKDQESPLLPLDGPCTEFANGGCEGR